MQVLWTKRAETAWLRAWERAPRTDRLLYTELISGATQAEMTAEANQLDEIKSLAAAMTLGESRHDRYDRIWISDLSLIYFFRVSVADQTLTVTDFRDPRML